MNSFDAIATFSLKFFSSFYSATYYYSLYITSNSAMIRASASSTTISASMKEIKVMSYAAVINSTLLLYRTFARTFD